MKIYNKLITVLVAFAFFIEAPGSDYLPTIRQTKNSSLRPMATVISNKKYSRRSFLIGAALGAAGGAGITHMNINRKRKLPSAPLLRDTVSQKEVEDYRFPFSLMLSPETNYDWLAWQTKLVASGKPLEFGPGFIYHGKTNLDDAIKEGKVIAGQLNLEDISKRIENPSKTISKDSIYRSYLTRVAHEWAVVEMDNPESSSPAIYMIDTQKFNRLVNEGKAYLDHTTVDPNDSKPMIDPYPYIAGSFPLDIVSEIWVRDDDYERYKNLANTPSDKLEELSEGERKLRQNLIPLLEKDVIKPLPLSRESLKKIDEAHRSSAARQIIGYWMWKRGLFEKIPAFKAKGEPLPENVPLTPRETVLKFISELPKDLPAEDVVARFTNNENFLSMLGYLSLLGYTLSYFHKTTFTEILPIWARALKKPDEMEKRSIEILKDDELVRLFILNNRKRKDDRSLQAAVFIWEDIRQAIETLAKKEYGAEVLFDDKALGIDWVVGCANSSTKREALAAFVSALDPKRLLSSTGSLYIPEDMPELDETKRVGILSGYNFKELKIARFIHRVIATIAFRAYFEDVYALLRKQGYSQAEAGSLLAEWSYNCQDVINAVSIKAKEINEALAAGGNEVYDPLKEKYVQYIADEIVRRNNHVKEYAKGLSLGAIAGGLSVGIWRRYAERREIISQMRKAKKEGDMRPVTNFTIYNRILMAA